MKPDKDQLSLTHVDVGRGCVKNERLRRPAVREGFAFPQDGKEIEELGFDVLHGKAQPFRTARRQSR